MAGGKLALRQTRAFISLHPVSPFCLRGSPPPMRPTKNLFHASTVAKSMESPPDVPWLTLTVRLRYVAENSAKFPEVMKMLGEKELNWIKKYDPDARVPILIVRDNGGTSGYLIGGGLKPSEAHAKEQTKKN
jgi:hypothetical protein